MMDKKDFTVADMVFKNRFLMTSGRSIFEVYESFVDEQTFDLDGGATYIFNDGSKIYESKELKIKRINK